MGGQKLDNDELEDLDLPEDDVEESGEDLNDYLIPELEELEELADMDDDPVEFTPEWEPS